MFRILKDYKALCCHCGPVMEGSGAHANYNAAHRPDNGVLGRFGIFLKVYFFIILLG